MFPNCFFNIEANLSDAILIHATNPAYRDSIKALGLIPKVGKCFKEHWEMNDYLPQDGILPELVFARKVETIKQAIDIHGCINDIWLINLSKIENTKWFNDSGFINKGIAFVTYDSIPPEALSLIHTCSEDFE